MKRTHILIAGSCFSSIRLELMQVIGQHVATLPVGSTLADVVIIVHADELEVVSPVQKDAATPDNETILTLRKQVVRDQFAELVKLIEPPRWDTIEETGHAFPPQRPRSPLRIGPTRHKKNT
jgi:hypothetical protein